MVFDAPESPRAFGQGSHDTHHRHHRNRGRAVMFVTANRFAIVSGAFAVLVASGSGALAQKKYDTGATDTEIKIGNIMPYTGPASAYAATGKTKAPHLTKIHNPPAPTTP